MKKHKMLHSIFASALLIANVASAQPTLTASTNNPVAGDVFTGYNCQGSACDTAGIGAAIAISGANVTWNLSAITASSLDTFTFISSAGTPYIDSFPLSNLADILSTLGANIYCYWIVNVNEWAESGYYDNGAGHFTKPYIYLNYPLTYNSTFIDTCSSFSLPITANYYNTAIDKYVCDAYGTLVLPSGIYTNVLRIHTTEYDVDSLSGSPSSDNTFDTLEYYYWYQPNFHFILLNISYSVSSGIPYFNDVLYYTQSATGVTEVNKNTINMNLFPNPTTTSLTITSPQNITNITITNLIGQTVYTHAYNSPQVQVNVADLPPGIYFVKINNTEVRKFVKS